MRFVPIEDLPCHNCIHRTGDGTCKAYPNGIPEYYNNGVDLHVEKEPEQTGDFLLETTEEYKKRRVERVKDTMGMFAKCKLCGERIEIMNNKNGERVPINIEPSVIVDEGTRKSKQVRLKHFVTCSKEKSKNRERG